MNKDEYYTQEEIRILTSNPNVRKIAGNRLLLTYEFRKQLYEEWCKKPYEQAIRMFLIENGFDIKLLKPHFFVSTQTSFRKKGGPATRPNEEYGISQIGYKTNEEIYKQLLSSGVFIKSSHGIKFTNQFISEVASTYPAISIQEKLTEKGVDPKIVGYHRIRSLAKELVGEHEIKEDSHYGSWFITKYKNHPYVKRLTGKRMIFKDEFYIHAKYFIDCEIDEILKLFNFEPNDFTYVLKEQIMMRLRNGTYENKENITDISILSNIIKKLNVIIEITNHQLEGQIRKAPKIAKKEVIKLINDTLNKGKIEIANNLGISKSNYYAILSNDNYGLYDIKKERRKEEAYSNIKKVIESDPYPMGKRTIYMKMDKICGFHYSIKKIAKIMKENNLRCPIRNSKKSLKSINDLVKNNTKPNYLNRRFRLGRPNEIKLTDVTYLKINKDQTFYKSVIKDAVTGKIDTCVISNNNDLKLVEDTVMMMDENSFGKSAIFHSDQGTLYLSDSFQNLIKSKGFIQSMSKRGNSQDNASCESYFGHFKDECDYSNCKDLNEAIEKVSKYIDYYNNRRPQWNRNKMTPCEYEKYLLSMNEEEYEKYLNNEQEKYYKMKERAKKLAIKRNKTLGVIDDEFSTKRIRDYKVSR